MLAALSLTLPGSVATAGDRRDLVVERGFLYCGLIEDRPGFALRSPGAGDDAVAWRGFDADICRAIAAALFGDSDRVRFVGLAAADAITALQSGDVDLLAGGIAWTLSRDTDLALGFGPATYHDGQGFLVSDEMTAHTAFDLLEARICAVAGSGHVAALATHFRIELAADDAATMANLDAALEAFEAGRCDAVTGPQTGLAGYLADAAPRRPARLLADTISHEVLGPVVLDGDPAWLALVGWTVHTLVQAEALGVIQAEIDLLRHDGPADIQAFLDTPAPLGGWDGGWGDAPGPWVATVIGAVGNYGEVFGRHLGRGTTDQPGLGLARGLNDLVVRGGLLHAPPFR